MNSVSVVCEFTFFVIESGLRESCVLVSSSTGISLGDCFVMESGLTITSSSFGIEDFLEVRGFTESCCGCSGVFTPNSGLESFLSSLTESFRAGCIFSEFGDDKSSLSVSFLTEFFLEESRVDFVSGMSLISRLSMTESFLREVGSLESFFGTIFLTELDFLTPGTSFLSEMEFLFGEYLSTGSGLMESQVSVLSLIDSFLGVCVFGVSDVGTVWVSSESVDNFFGVRGLNDSSIDSGLGVVFCECIV